MKASKICIDELLNSEIDAKTLCQYLEQLEFDVVMQALEKAQETGVVFTDPRNIY